MGLKEYIKRGIKYIISGVPEKIVYANVSYLEPDNRLNGKKIIVTGGGRGLGFAMAKKFVSEGAEVIIAGRNEEVLKNTAQIINCKFIKLNLEDVSSFEEFFEAVIKEMGYVDCLVNNAGISLHEGSIDNVTLEQFNRQVNTNLRGAYFLSQKFSKYLIKNKLRGNILFVSSERGSYVDDLPYGITKASINSFTQGLAKRLIEYGIRVNAVAPGVTASDMTGFSENGNLYCSYNITERVYLPDEVAEVACFLLSEASKCISGQILVCNEGKSINSHW